MAEKTRVPGVNHRLLYRYLSSERD